MTRSSETSEMTKMAKQNAIARMSDQLALKMRREMKNEEAVHKCFFCWKNHHSTDCTMEIGQKQKWLMIIKNRRCTVCMGRGHNANRCYAWRNLPNLVNCREKTCLAIGLVHNNGICPFRDNEMEIFWPAREFYLKATNRLDIVQTVPEAVMTEEVTTEEVTSILKNARMEEELLENTH